MTVRIETTIVDGDGSRRVLVAESATVTAAAYLAMGQLARLVREDLEAVIGDMTRLAAFGRVLLDAVGDPTTPGAGGSESRFTILPRPPVN